MRKLTFAAIALLMVASFAVAQSDLNVFLDVRPDTGGIGSITTPAAPFTIGQDFLPPNLATPICNGGGAGEGQILRLSPRHDSGFHTMLGGVAYPNFDADNDLSTGSFYVYAEMSDKDGGGDVLSSLGLDFLIADAPGSLGNGHQIDTVSHTWTDLTLWSPLGTADGTSDLLDPPSIIGAKAVHVPVAVGPTYNVTTGLTPPLGMTQVSELAVAAGDFVCGSYLLADSTFEVHMNVNNLLITRAFNPATPPAVPSAEAVSFGYDSLGGAPFAASMSAEDAAIDGSVSPGVSALPDGIIRIQLKGDFTGDGIVNNFDSGIFVALQAGQLPANQSFTYMFDFTLDGVVNNFDSGALTAIFAGNLMNDGDPADQRDCFGDE